MLCRGGEEINSPYSIDLVFLPINGIFILVSSLNHYFSVMCAVSKIPM